MSRESQSLEYLLDLHGMAFVVDDQLGLWVKFEAQRVSYESRINGVRYSLSLHDRFNQRILGFDNAHAVKAKGHKLYVFDHWHHDANDKGRPYHYEDAGQLVEDFWEAVDKRVTLMKEQYHEQPIEKS